MPNNDNVALFQIVNEMLLCFYRPEQSEAQSEHDTVIKLLNEKMTDKARLTSVYLLIINRLYW